MSNSTCATKPHAADGFAERTGWVGADDGLLVRDLNGNNRIDSGRELFGSETLLTNGSKAANGFIALAELDSNHDKKIDASDTAFASLRIWKDKDTDGTTDAGELLSLADAGVQSINLGYTTSNTVDENGNAHKQVGSYTTTGGATRTATDVWFTTDTMVSIAMERLNVPADIAALPDAAGYGKVYSLQQAMVRDTSGKLKNLMLQFAQATTLSQREALVQSIIYQWTGVQDMSPGSRGTAIGDARKLEALEQFMGEVATKRVAFCARSTRVASRFDTPCTRLRDVRESLFFRSASRIAFADFKQRFGFHSKRTCKHLNRIQRRVALTTLNPAHV